MLKGYKTYISGGLMILTGVLMYLTGEWSLQEAATMAFGGLTDIFLRNGVRSGIADVKEEISAVKDEMKANPPGDSPDVTVNITNPPAE